MSGSVTVIGGVNNSTVTGLVTVPAVLPSGSVLSALQAFLSNNAGGAVTAGGAIFQNLNVANQQTNVSGEITVGSGAAGLLDITNTNGTGATTAGSAAVSFTVPSAYNYLVVQAPGTETVSGNGNSNFLAAFGSLAGVTFNTGGGSGTVVAGGPSDFTVLQGNAWSFVGSGVGGETVAGVATNSTIDVAGTGAGAGNPSNVVAIDASNVTANAAGTNDLIESFDGSGGVISVTGGANVLVNGGSVSVYAAAGVTSINAFFEQGGGQLYFVNNSTIAATVSGSVNDSVSGGNVTAFGNAGGGVYVGGIGGNNYLVGGTGISQLVAEGGNSTLVAGGSGTNSLGSTNVLEASSGSDSLVATVGSSANEFIGAGGSTTMVSFGSGLQTFLVGTSGQEVITGSTIPTVPGHSNNYYFDTGTVTGSGTDIITNFRIGVDALLIHDGTAGGQSIVGITQNLGQGGGVIVQLSDQTTIKLYGVSLTAADAASAAGGGYTL